MDQMLEKYVSLMSFKLANLQSPDQPVGAVSQE
jgi:hypothetical protein